MSEFDVKSSSKAAEQPIESAKWVRIYQLIYFSASRIPMLGSDVRGEIEGILNVATKRNAQFGVTGALTFNEFHFAQVLEGPYDSVKTIFAGIKRDSRHTNIEVLQEGWVEARDFSRWAMAYVGEEASMHFISADIKLKDILSQTRESAALGLVEMMKFWLLNSR